MVKTVSYSISPFEGVQLQRRKTKSEILNYQISGKGIFFSRFTCFLLVNAMTVPSGIVLIHIDSALKCICHATGGSGPLF